MDPPDDPHGSQVGEPQNGPAAEEEPVHSNQDSSQFKTIGTVISRRGTQSGRAHFLSSTTHKDLSSTSSMIKFIVVLSIFLQIFLSYTSASCTTSNLLVGTKTSGRNEGMSTTTKIIGLSCIDQETHGGQIWSTGWPASSFESISIGAFGNTEASLPEDECNFLKPGAKLQVHQITSSPAFLTAMEKLTQGYRNTLSHNYSESFENEYSVASNMETFDVETTLRFDAHRLLDNRYKQRTFPMLGKVGVDYVHDSESCIDGGSWDRQLETYCEGAVPVMDTHTANGLTVVLDDNYENFMHNWDQDITHTVDKEANIVAALEITEHPLLFNLIKCKLEQGAMIIRDALTQAVNLGTSRVLANKKSCLQGLLNRISLSMENHGFSNASRKILK